MNQSRSQPGQSDTELALAELMRLQTQSEIERLRSHIEWMETSKFWKLRKIVLKLQKLLSLKFSDQLRSDLSDWLSSTTNSSRDSNSDLTQFSDLLPNAKQLLTNLGQITLKTFLNSDFKLKLPTAHDPKVSIILVLFNRAELTYLCLRSLCELSLENFEIIIFDNASSDSTRQLLSKVEGATIILNAANIHFLSAVNEAANQAQGQYLLLLNNDAQILPGSLTSAIRTLESDVEIEAVGGKIILPDGRLQEAGSIVWQDGSCLGYGRDDNPFAPMYMFQRDVDYCSGAFLLTYRDTFLSLGGFDRSYFPAYYEETDYCTRLWKLGKRVVYDPHAVILHYEFASSGTTNSAIKLQSERQKIFLEKHQHQLENHLPPSESNILMARSHHSGGKRLLFIDDKVPHLYLGSGFPRSNKILQGLHDLGFLITIYPTDANHESWDAVYADLPRQIEVMLGENYSQKKLAEFCSERIGYYDVVMVSRPHNMQLLQTALENVPTFREGVKLIYDAEAVFSLRDVLFYQLIGQPLSSLEASNLIHKELELAQKADVIISVSEAEQQKIKSFGFSNVKVLGHAIAAQPLETPFQNRKDILFVGSIYDEKTPNADSVLWFVNDVLPRLNQLTEQDIKLIIVGVNKVKRVAELASQQVILTGKVDDLSSLYSSARVFVAPTRFAAGIPHKVHEAAAKGLPVISTSLIAAQLEWNDGEELLTADSPEEFAQQCVKLYTDSELWHSVRANALQKVSEDCSEENFASKLTDIARGLL
jgi:GT2 family glycosyltransferase